SNSLDVLPAEQSGVYLSADLLPHWTVLEPEEREHVARADLEGFVGRHARKEPLGERARVGPVALDVREVGREHDALDAHVMPELDRHALHVLHAEENVLLHVLARLLLERLEVQEPRGPVAVPL